MASEAQAANDLITWAVGLPSLGVIITFVLSMIRRRMSADSKVVNEDRSYKDMLESYKKERDEIKIDRDIILTRVATIEAERNEAVAKVGKLTVEVEYLTVHVLELKLNVEKLGASLEVARTEMQKFAIENVKLVANVEYLEAIVHKTTDTPNGGA